MYIRNSSRSSDEFEAAAVERLLGPRGGASPGGSPRLDIGLANLSPQQRRLLQDLASGPLHEEELLQQRREKQHGVKKAQKALIGRMMSGWTSQQTKGRAYVAGSGNAGKKVAGEEAVPEKKELILAHLDERIGKFAEALFNVWKDRKGTIPPEAFCQKMVTFGLAPDIKFIHEVTTVTHLNYKPKQPPARAARAGEKTPSRSARGSRANLHESARSAGRGGDPAGGTASPFAGRESEAGGETPASAASALQRRPTFVAPKSPTLHAGGSLPPALRKQQTSVIGRSRNEAQGSSAERYSVGPSRDRPRDDDSCSRSGTGSRPPTRTHAAHAASPHGRPQAKEDDDKCTAVRLQVFKGIYGNGTQ